MTSLDTGQLGGDVQALGRQALQRHVPGTPSLLMSGEALPCRRTPVSTQTHFMSVCNTSAIGEITEKPKLSSNFLQGCDVNSRKTNGALQRIYSSTGSVSDVTLSWQELGYKRKPELPTSNSFWEVWNTCLELRVMSSRTVIASWCVWRSRSG